MRRTKIVATIGPASRDQETLARMVDAGLDVARLNFSHGSREIHAENAERVRAAASSAGRQVAILQDLPGPKLRIGALRDDIADLKPGEKLLLVFTRTVDSSCLSQLKTPECKLVDLPMNQPVEVAVTVPANGEVGFACGMDMFHGVVVAQPNS